MAPERQLGQEMSARDVFMPHRNKSTRPADLRLKLELFSEKAGLLENSRFLAWLTGGPRHFALTKVRIDCGRRQI